MGGEYGEGVFGVRRMGWLHWVEGGDCIAFRLEFTSSGLFQVPLGYTYPTSQPWFVYQREIDTDKASKLEFDTRIYTGRAFSRKSDLF